MEGIFKLVGQFFPDKMRETKEQKSLVERTLLLSRTYPGLAESIDTILDFPNMSIPEPSPEEKDNMLKNQLEYFHALENKLIEEGLINEE
ncbi:MAG: hypothetical protein LBS55_10280 [Prevotellaceae bacterium]|jgi:hypothetical protein|nr:hypothetical protein [Prevotellaceae bacterium]